MLIAPLDTETTGFLEPEHRIIEVYMDLIRVGSGASTTPIWTLNQRIDPERGIGVEAQRVHGISSADLIGKPTWDKVAPVLHKALSRADLIVAHNAAFDYGFLNMEFERIGLQALTTPYFCTMENSIWATSNGKKPSLAELCFAMGVEYDPNAAHAADYDVHVMTDCLMRGLEWGSYVLPVKEAAVPA